MDLVDAFLDIGLPEGASEAEASVDPIAAARRIDAAAPNIDQLHRAFIVTRGRTSRSPQGD